MNPKTEILDPFDFATELFENREHHIQTIDNYLELMGRINCQEIQGGYFYNCADVDGFCEPDDDSLTYVSQNQFSSIRPKEYEDMIENPILQPLYALHDAMVKIDLYYPLLFNIGDSIKQLQEYQSFQKRIETAKLYIQPYIDKSIPPHINAINYVTNIKGIL
jgi:hypothetical protein